MILNLITLLCCIIAGQSITWTNFPNTRTGRSTLIVIQHFVTNSSVEPSVLVTFTGTSWVKPKAWGVGITWLNSPITNEFNLNVSVLSVTLTEMEIGFRVSGDTIIEELQVRYIAVADAASCVQMIHGSFLCNGLNSGTGLRTQTRQVESALPNTENDLSAIVVLTSFQVRNTQGINIYLKASSTVVTRSATILLTFQTSQNTTVASIGYSVIVFSPELAMARFKFFGHTGTHTLTNSSFTVAIPLHYQGANKNFFGMSGFNFSRGISKYFGFNTSNYASVQTGYVSNYGTHAVTIAHFYFVYRICEDPLQTYYDVNNNICVNSPNCPPNTALFTTSPTYSSYCDYCHYSCLTCSSVSYTNCTTCESSTYRLYNSTRKTCLCTSEYFDVGVSICAKCSSLIPGCNQCNSKTVCTVCNAGYVLNGNYTCSCTSGFLVSGICTSITGCTDAILLSNTVYCMSCNFTLNFQFVNNSFCQCITGFSIVDNVCKPICGDGLLIAQQKCDDHNVIDGDGCSSICIIETGWNCVNTTNITRASHCTIIMSPNLTLKYVKRNPYANQMIIAIAIQPYNQNYLRMKYKPYASHGVPVSNYNISYDRTTNLLMLTFDYNQTIQKNNYSLNFQLDPHYFTANSVSLQIPAAGMNTQLTYDSYCSFNLGLEYCVIGLCALALIVLFLSAFSERLIGIEMIQVLQFSLFAMPLMNSIPSNLSPLQMLKYSNGYNILNGNDPSRTYTYTFLFSGIGIQKEFLLSCNIMLCIVLLVLTAAALLRSIQFYYFKMMERESTEDGFAELESKHKKVQSAYNFVFERLLFIVGFISMFLICYSFTVQLNNLSSPYTLITLELNMFTGIVAVLIVVWLVTLIVISAVFPRTRFFPFYLHRTIYPPYFFLYQTLVILTLSLGYQSQWVLYFLMALTALNAVLLIIARPYQEHIHNAAIVFNQFTILAVLGTYLFATIDSARQNQLVYLILAITIIALLFAVVIWSAVRLWKWRAFFLQNINKWRKTQQVYQDSSYIKLLNKNRAPKFQIAMELNQNTNKQPDFTPKTAIQPFDWRYNQMPNSAEDRILKTPNTRRLLLDKQSSDRKRTPTDRVMNKQSVLNILETSRNQMVNSVQGQADFVKDGEIDDLGQIKSKLRRDLLKKLKISNGEQVQE